MHGSSVIGPKWRSVGVNCLLSIVNQLLRQCQQLMSLQFSHLWIQRELSAVPSYSGVDAALTVCSASVGPVVEPAATVVAIFRDSEQSGSRAQQCQRSQSVTAILRKRPVQTVQSPLFKLSSNIQCSTVAFRVQWQNDFSIKKIIKHSIYIYNIYLYSMCVCVCSARYFPSSWQGLNLHSPEAVFKTVGLVKPPGSATVGNDQKKWKCTVSSNGKPAVQKK